MFRYFRVNVLAVVAVSGLPEGSVVIDGAVGSLRVGTLVKTNEQGPQ